MGCVHTTYNVVILSKAAESGQRVEIYYIYSGSEFKRRTCKSITQVYPITGPVMNFKV